jgi:hypothetical protein
MKMLLEELQGLFQELSYYFFNFIMFVIRGIENKVHRRIVVKRVVSEHFSFMVWTFKRVVLPISLCYLIIGFLCQRMVFDSLVLGLIVFVYGNFLPDLDSLFIRRGKRSVKKLSLFKKYVLLCLAPLYVYMIYFGVWEIPFSNTSKVFHNFKSAIIFGAFLFLLGFVLYTNLVEVVSPPIFGLLGYLAHLKVDKYW